jgi:hypothetical protein
MEERHFKVNFSLSGERDRVERCDGGIPLAQGFHRETVGHWQLQWSCFSRPL